MNSVLLDTSFLITFADPTRPHHQTAHLYLRECVARQVPMFLSTVVASEFHVGQPVLLKDGFDPAWFNGGEMGIGAE